MSKPTAEKIAKEVIHRHLSVALLILLIGPRQLLLTQSNYRPVNVSDRDVRELIDFYKTGDPSAAVAVFRNRMPSEIKDESFRSSIHRQLPGEYIARTIHDEKLTEALRIFLRPVLSLYGRYRVYDLILVDSATPIMMSDSGVVLVVSTGMISTANSDDELLGYTAHEVAHEFFASYSIYSNHILRLIADRGSEPILNRHMREVLAIIELQCDAFATLTLDSLGYNPRELADGLDRIRAAYPNYPFGNHPSDQVRRSIIEGIVPTLSLQVKPRVSVSLKVLKDLVKKR